MALSSERDELRESGFMVVRGVLPGAATRRLQRAFELALPTGNLSGVVQRPRGLQDRLVLRDWLSGSPLGELARGLLGCEEVGLLQDVLIAKGPGQDGVIAWHRDAWYLAPPRPDAVISVRLALDDETLQSGGLEVLPGSHRWPEVYEAPQGTASKLPRRARELLAPELRRTPAHAVILAAGDLSVHLARTWHASGVNRGTGHRRTLVTHLYDARWPPPAAPDPPFLLP